MVDPYSAELASSTERGYADHPLKVKLIQDSLQENVESTSRNKTTQSTDKVSAEESSNFQDYESLVLRKMRQAEERKRLESEIMEQDKLQDSSII